MGKRLEAKVWASALKSELKPLAAAIADIADDDGYSVYAAVDYFAWLLGDQEWWEPRQSKDRTVQRQLDELMEMTVLRVLDPETGDEIADLERAFEVRRKGGRRRASRENRGTGNATNYRFREDALPGRTVWSERYKGDRVSPLKGDITSPLTVTNPTKSARNGDIVSPLQPNGDMVSPLTVTTSFANGDTNPPARVTKNASNGDMVSPDPPSYPDYPEAAVDVGEKIKSALSLRITKGNFKTYFETALFDVHNGRLYIGVESEFAATQINARMKAIVLHVCNEEGISEFETAVKAPAGAGQERRA